MKEEAGNIKDNLIDKAWNNLDTQGFFGNQDLLDFFLKKTERIAAAIHLVSNLFDSQEPVKWRIRSLSIDLVRTSGMLSFSLITEKQKTLLLELNKVFVDIKSLLEILSVAGMLSPMNQKVLLVEIEALLDLVPKPDSVQKSQYFDEGFFLNKLNQNSIFSELINRSNDDKGSYYKVLGDKKPLRGIKDISYKGHISGAGNEKKATFTGGESSGGVNKKNRRNLIISAIQKSGEVSIKDISVFIKDCSEKTLQRELLAMVDENVLKKEGERRWSRYSLRTDK